MKSPSQASLLERVLEPHYWSFLLTADEYDRLAAHVQGRRPRVRLSELQYDADARRKHAESQVTRDYHSFLVAFYGLRVDRLGDLAFDPGTLQLTLPQDVSGLKDAGSQRAIDYLVQMILDTPAGNPPILSVDDCDMLQTWLKHHPWPSRSFAMLAGDPQGKAQWRDHQDQVAHLKATCAYNCNRLQRQHQASILPDAQVGNTSAADQTETRSRSAPMSKAQLARRIFNNPAARGRKLTPSLLRNLDLVQVHGTDHVTIDVSSLDMHTRARVMRPITDPDTE